MTERRRFIVKAGGMVAAATAATIVKALWRQFRHPTPKAAAHTEMIAIAGMLLPFDTRTISLRSIEQAT